MDCCVSWGGGGGNENKNSTSCHFSLDIIFNLIFLFLGHLLYVENSDLLSPIDMPFYVYHPSPLQYLPCVPTA